MISKKNAPLVSIIVPVYNAGKTVKKALDSILDQSYENIEVICIDDGSTDDSAKILAEYGKKDSRIKVFLNKKNKGIAYTRNRGLDLVNGKFLMWCDADDWFEEDTVKEMLEPMDEIDIDFAVCETNIIHDEKLKERLLLEKFAYAVTLPKGELQEVDSDIFWNLSCVLWNKIFRMDLIKKYNIKCSDTKSAEDEAFIYKYYSVSKVYYCVHKKLYNHFRNESGITAKQIHKKSTDIINSIKDVKEFIHKYKLSRYYEKINDLLNSKKVYYSNLVEKLLKVKLAGLVKSLNSKNFTLDDDEIIEDNKTYNIFYTVDEENIQPMIVSIISLIKNANHDEHFNLHIIYKKLENLETLKSLLSFEKHTVKFIQLSKKQIQRLGNLQDDLSTYKFFIPEIIENMERCLYLDNDTIITSSVHELYIKKLKKNYLAAVEQAYSSEEKGKITKFINVQNYFNTGVMLMNLTLMKEDKLTDKLIFARKNLEEYLSADITKQVFNLIVENNYQFIEPKFNLQTEIWEDSRPLWCYTNEQLDFAKSNPVIIHYSGKLKPWNSVCPHLWKDEYFKYLKIAPKNHLCYWKNI